ncbi:unnamed protein product [Callosobruchus maculatus]|uniref:Uncharacterized protein n=1 Tax=Callosobruchus maculatus TaxID=64391 RepID=A0A653DUU9_CALMS|nr:unnamed protein product [Callosobruchus maculatus]
MIRFIKIINAKFIVIYFQWSHTNVLDTPTIRLNKLPNSCRKLSQTLPQKLV